MNGRKLLAVVRFTNSLKGCCKQRSLLLPRGSTPPFLHFSSTSSSSEKASSSATTASASPPAAAAAAASESSVLHPWEKLFEWLNVTVYPIEPSTLELLESEATRSHPSSKGTTSTSSSATAPSAGVVESALTAILHSVERQAYEIPPSVVESYLQVCLRWGFRRKAAQLLKAVYLTTTTASSPVYCWLDKPRVLQFLTIQTSQPEPSIKREHQLSGPWITFLLDLAELDGVDLDLDIYLTAIQLCLYMKDSYGYVCYDRLRKLSGGGMVPPSVSIPLFDLAVFRATQTMANKNVGDIASVYEGKADVEFAITLAEHLVEAGEPLPEVTSQQLLHLLTLLQHPKLTFVLQQYQQQTAVTSEQEASPLEQQQRLPEQPKATLQATIRAIQYRRKAEEIIAAVRSFETDETYRAVIRRLGNFREGFHGRRVYYQMRAAGIHPSRGTYLIFISVLSESGYTSAEFALQVYEDMKCELGLHALNTNVFETALEAALRCRKGESMVGHLRQVLSDFTRSRITPDATLWEVLIKVNQVVDILPYCGTFRLGTIPTVSAVPTAVTASTSTSTNTTFVDSSMSPYPSSSSNSTSTVVSILPSAIRPPTPTASPVADSDRGSPSEISERTSVSSFSSASSSSTAPSRSSSVEWAQLKRLLQQKEEKRRA